MAKYIYARGGNGYCGCDWDEYLEVDDDLSDEEIDALVDNIAFDWAEGYADRVDFESNEDEEEYYENICAYTCWEEISYDEFIRNV